MHNYVLLSIETHLFFARIMKEHALFLQAGFTCKDKKWIEKADCLRTKFENLLSDVVTLSNGRIGNEIIESNELVTEFTIAAEKKTAALSGADINIDISAAEMNLKPDVSFCVNKELFQSVRQINIKSITFLNELISFKENILQEVNGSRLFTFNYPLLIEHILREARLYRDTISNLMQGKCSLHSDIKNSEAFWNQIMMEHALFIRGLLDPGEEELIRTADGFAKTYKRLLREADLKDRLVSDVLSYKTFDTTIQLQKFKAAGTKGILCNEISSLILPLLADHVLREANHFIRILKCSSTN
ncbi:MAG: DUF2935 domain-containing protein [Eubacteriales bacterium]|nr:DUF2935 domain-containing protein [Eubacteriales bacterium]